MKKTEIMIGIIVIGIMLAIMIPNFLASLPNRTLPALHKAVFTGDMETIHSFLRRNGRLHEKDPLLHATPLHWAILHGDKGIVDMLVTHGSDVNAKDGDSATPLHYAATLGRVQIAQVLLASGANIFTQDHFGHTPLLYAINNDTVSGLHPLRKLTYGVNYLREPSLHALIPQFDIEGKQKMVELLLEKGSKPGIYDLHEAARSGDVAIFKMLLSRGFDVNAASSDGWTSLHYAALNAHQSLIQFLVSQGANIHARTDDGETPLMCAARSRSGKEILELLIDKDVDISKFDNPNGGCFTLLSNAIINREALEFFVSQGMDITTPEGEAALRSAAYNLQHDVVEVFLIHNVNVNAKDLQGRTVLHYAVNRKRQNLGEEHVNIIIEIVELLLKYGANINEQDNNGITPLHLARENQLEDIVHVLRLHGAHDKNAHDTGKESN